MTDWKKVQGDFPICRNMTYFQSAGMAPISQPVFDTLVSGYRQILEAGDIGWEKDVSDYHQLCEQLALSIHALPGDVTFAPNSSTAYAWIAQSFKNNASQPFHIISLQDEFPATTVPFEFLKIPIRYVPPRNHRYHIDDILQQADGQTLAVVVSYVQYGTGFRLDLSALGAELKKRKIWFIVNATQAYPYFPIDCQRMGIDALTASLHKWGGASHVGAMFHTSAAFRKAFPAAACGWLSVATADLSIYTAKNEPFQAFADARQYEWGTINFKPLLALKTAIDYFQAIGLEQICQRLLQLTDYLTGRLSELDVEVISPRESVSERSAIVSFSTSTNNAAVVRQLEEQKIFTAIRQGIIRVSVNIFNSHEDIDRLIQALREIL